MQILVLAPEPQAAARRLASAKLPGKLFLEAMQLLGGALRQHGLDHPKLYRVPNPKHPCCVWVASGQDAFLWTLAYARECHKIFNVHIRKRCCRCRGFKKAPHASLATLEHIESIVRANALPDSMPAKVDAERFYAKIAAIRSAQHPKAQEKSGKVLRPTSGLPEGCATMALAIDGAHQATCLRYDAQGDLDGVASYRAYHSARVPKSDSTWHDPRSDAALPTHDCSCAPARRSTQSVLVAQCP